MIVLTKRQTKAIDRLEDQVTTDILFGGGAGGAKSVLGCHWQIKNRFKYPGTRGLVGRSKLKTLKQTTLNTLWEVMKMHNITSNHYSYNAQSSEINFSNGSQIVLKDLFSYPSDPNFDELGSLEITDAFIDEANQVSAKAKNIVKARIRYKLDGRLPKQLMTCNPAKNWAYSEFYKPFRDGTLPDHIAFVEALAKDNPHLPDSYINQLKSLDKNTQQRLLYGNWEYDDDPATMIDYDAILNIFTNQHVNGESQYITADIARLGKDKTVIGVWQGWKLINIITISKSDLTEPIMTIREIATSRSIPMSKVIVDEDGVGGGVKDVLRCKGFVNNSKPLNKKGNYTNLKSEAYFHFARKVNSFEVFCQYETTNEEREHIIEELEMVKKKDIDKDGKNSVLPKDQVKELLGRSPDYSDMMMMRSWFDLRKRGIAAAS